MKLFIIIAILALTCQAELTKQCQKACEQEADDIIAIIPQFQGDFDLQTFIQDVQELKKGYEVVKEKCEGHMWGAIVDIVIDALTDDLKSCAGKVIVAIESVVDLIESFGHKWFVIVRKATIAINDVKAAISECKNNDSVEFLELDQEYVEVCTKSLMEVYPIAEQYFSGKQNNANVFSFFALAANVKVQCWDHPKSPFGFQEIQM